MASLCLYDKEKKNFFHGFWGPAQSGSCWSRLCPIPESSMFSSTCRVFTDTDLFLKSSSCIHLVNPYSPSGLSLISFSWMLASPSLARLNHWLTVRAPCKAPSEHCFMAEILHNVFVIVLDWHLSPPLQIVNSLRERDCCSSGSLHSTVFSTAYRVPVTKQRQSSLFQLFWSSDFPFQTPIGHMMF